ncbi:MacB family efflux pump subunit [Bartonella sp. TP]|uniref:MacB family efflux pump subunit n=1 Tax=Bartonella sp. TP TaxID=3057550 RepID=UPI0025B0DFFF|nr:MacB family efflux pump subunit [Bartonella sp. TP]WJW79530.1 MacB family efflux pump subunit [Bartonella sp. TP]
MQPLVVLKNIKRVFRSGEADVYVLKDINLTINKGEMVAIIGSSGSGKSTLMNILGCLDKPSGGAYEIAGQNIADLDSDQLSQLRRNYFGFIFQRYHLLPALSALGNVEIPAIYSGMAKAERFKHAAALLQRLGLGERLYHKPNQLSGGQQQRVSIARALINNAEIILADEPTGALDKHSGEEVLKILDELHQGGRTIIIVTHDTNVAQKAQRIIEISDGNIIADYLNEHYKTAPFDKNLVQEAAQQSHSQGRNAVFDRLRESFAMSMLSLLANPMRSFLTMLGIIIGIAAVISMVALGNGTQAQIMANINSLGSNTLTIYPGKSMSDARAGLITTLTDSDAKALEQQPYVAGVTPEVSGNAQVSYGDISAHANVTGASEQLFVTKKLELAQGNFFTKEDVLNRNLDMVIDQQTADTVFGKNASNILGKTLFIGSAVGRVIGIVKNYTTGPASKNLQIYLPYSSVQTRFLGNDHSVQSIILRVADNIDSNSAEQAVTKFLTMRHGGQDFFIRNSEEFRKKVNQSVGVLTLLVSSIALISLIVGGIGVMNIMLVTVSERINEIGVRMAVGARQSDILQQFLIEAVLVCMLGGIIGILLGLSLSLVFELVHAPFKLLYSTSSIIVAFVFSSLIGVGFGFMPARNASKLDPVSALSRD